MKACVIQPPYSMDLSLSDAYFAKKLELMDACDPSMDLIVLPEYSDVPCAAATREDNIAYSEKYRPVLLKKAAETARRCDAVLFVNAYDLTPTGYRNTTYAFDRSGEIAGKYYKKHLPPSEQFTIALDSDYTFEPSAPYVLTIDGIRYAFLTCYDFYFYEAFAAIARENVDIIIGCSLQRSDTHEALEIMGRFLAYNTNAYVVRASVSLDGSPEICGASMIVAPTGKMLVNMKSRVGLETAEFDPRDKYYKPAGFGGKPASHYEYIEFGRHGWQYRPGGTAIVPSSRFMKYPRVCAHRGFSAVLPENTLAAFGAAVGMGAHEFEFDLWPTCDRDENGNWCGEIVSVHDSSLERLSDGAGYIWEKTWDELQTYDFGVKHGEEFRGTRILTFEQILQKFSCHAVMAIHLKTRNYTDPLPEAYLQKIITLIRRYDCAGYCYFLTGNKTLLCQLRTLAPDIARCCDVTDDPFGDTVAAALETGCERISFYRPYFEKTGMDRVQDTINRAHENGLRCNMFYADTAEETEMFLAMGADVIVTNHLQKVLPAVEKYRKSSG